ncbi:hypothetical protein [uncultured Rikenella sp.]|uniref:hypothetical protein n=1 Tax=uncultured Rikenella sp. TaxID=368003 RepID=UPI0026033FB4|nr:hypothetical protein [uncultured Rikenella sp.]
MPYGRAPGHRGIGDGALWYVGNSGYSWASQISGSNGMYLGFYATELRPCNTAGHAFGFPLRCLSE